ncbi:MAG: tRNA 4-thiouridine(8) synthase ThiI, partial [Oribacterium sp.]|nr:tRNA 4-thiouridine(8) synthase ThiI [Oribacterium sp.]
MQYQSFLIKYAEIGTKGKNRYVFEDALVHDIRKKLERAEGDFKVYRERGRIYVTVKSDNYDYEETVDALQHVFGIVSICPMIQMDSTHDYKVLSDKVISYFKEVYGDRKLTFKVNT